MEDERDTITLRGRCKKMSALNLSSCFQGGSRSEEEISSSSYMAPPSPHFLSPSWFRSRGGGGSCCSSSTSRLGRRRHSADFSYDPLSYALNFDDGGTNTTAEDLSSSSSTLLSFSGRMMMMPNSERRKILKDLELPAAVRRSKVLTKGVAVSSASDIKTQGSDIITPPPTSSAADTPGTKASGNKNVPHEISLSS